MAEQGGTLGILVRITTKEGERDACLAALHTLFEQSTQHPTFIDAAVYRDTAPEGIVLVERWAETAASFQERASSAEYFTRFEQEAGPLIADRQVSFFDGRPAWSKSA